MALVRRVTVNFYHIKLDPNLVQWAWFDVQFIPNVGDLIVTPRNNKWRVIARTWQEQQTPVETLNCNILVEDYTNGKAVVQ